MNKYQEALEFLRSENVTAWGNDKFELLYFHLDNIEELVDKATPKKPVHKKWNGIDGVPYDLCPNCKTNLCTTGAFGRDKARMKYCENCGQKLDWSDEDDE